MILIIENNRPRFGPAGNCDAFYSSGMKSTIQSPGWLKALGLNAYEYQCGRGVNISNTTASAFGDKAQQHGIQLSLHAPYYISLASSDPAKRNNSINYILDSARTVNLMGGNRIVVHPGGLGGVGRREATAAARETLIRAQKVLDGEGLDHIHICPETMGKINQLGDLDEVIEFCTLDERILPCVDFGHMNARTRGGVNSAEAFEAILSALENKLGVLRARLMHIHFSKIEYTSGGEKSHLTFDDHTFGPEPEPLMQLLAQREYTPVVICESRGTQSHDAVTLMRLFHK